MASASGAQKVPRRIQKNARDPLVKKIRSDSSTDTVVRQLQRRCNELESSHILASNASTITQHRPMITLIISLGRGLRQRRS